MQQRPEVLFLLRPATARRRFIVEHVLRRMLGWVAQEVTEEEARSTSGVPLLVMGGDPVPGAFHVAGMQELPTLAVAKDPAELLPTHGDHLGFDLFGIAFHFLALVQERSAAPRDEHGRLLASASLQARCGMLERPIVDELVLRFAAAWKRADDRVPPPKRSYRHVATLDVDNGFRYKGREWWRTIGAAGRDLLGLGFGRVSERLAVLSGVQEDPYDIYHAFVGSAAPLADRVVLNFLVAPRGPHDHAIGVSDTVMCERIREMARMAEVGLHPSYASSDQPELIAEERATLEAVVEGPVRISRQHFLRMRIPETLLELEHLGMVEDHSMGYSEHIGFRAGTCTPFPFYHLERDRETPLMLHPFCVMDSTLAYKMRLRPEEALERAKAMVDRVRAVNGTFCAVWHERFYSDHGPERGWKRVIEGTLIHAKP